MCYYIYRWFFRIGYIHSVYYSKKLQWCQFVMRGIIIYMIRRLALPFTFFQCFSYLVIIIIVIVYYDSKYDSIIIESSVITTKFNYQPYLTFVQLNTILLVLLIHHDRLQSIISSIGNSLEYMSGKRLQR